MLRQLAINGCIGLLAIGASACGTHQSSSMDNDVMTMLMKMGVPGKSATPNRAAMALDCPPVRAMVEKARQSTTPLSPMSKELLNAWAQWCDIPELS